MYLSKHRFIILITCLSCAAIVGAGAQEEKKDQPKKERAQRTLKRDVPQSDKLRKAKPAPKKAPRSVDQGSDKSRFPDPSAIMKEEMKKRMDAMREKFADGDGKSGWSPEKMEAVKKHMMEMQKKFGGDQGRGGPPWMRKQGEGERGGPPWANKKPGPAPKDAKTPERKGPPEAGNRRGQGHRGGDQNRRSRDGRPGPGGSGSPSLGSRFRGSPDAMKMMMFRRMQAMRMMAMARARHGSQFSPGKGGPPPGFPPQGFSPGKGGPPPGFPPKVKEQVLCDNCKAEINRKSDKNDKSDKKAKKKKRKKAK